MTIERELLRKIVDYMWEGELVDEIKELLAQPEQEPLSDEEMRAIWKEGIRGEIPFVEIGRAIEKAHGIAISLRDHFAGLAMQGLLASPVMGDCALHNSSVDWLKDITKCSYDFADKMLAEREKK
jgi:hypothetical protein